MPILDLGRWESMWHDDTYDGLKDVSLGDAVRMMRKGSIVRHAFEFGSQNVQRRFGEYQNTDRPDIEDDVRERVMPAVMRSLGGLMTAWYFGAALAEPVYDLSDGLPRLHTIRTAHPDKWWDGRPHRDEALGDIDAWEMPGKGRVEFFNEMGIRQLVLARWGSDFDSPRGDGCVNRVWPHDRAVREMYKDEAIGANVAALHRIIMQGNSDDPDALCAAYTKLANLGAMYLPAQEVEQITQLTGDFGGGSPFEDPIRRHVVGIYLGFFQPSLIHTEAQFGTRAQASVQLEGWIGAETALTEWLIDQVVMYQVIAPYVAMRWGVGSPIGDIPVRDPAPPELAQWATILTSLFTAGVFDPLDVTQLRWARQRFEMPTDDLDNLADGVRLPNLDAGQEQRVTEVQS